MMIKDWVVVVPVPSPMPPAPAETTEPADSEAESEVKIRAAEPNSRIFIPSRPRQYRISVDQPRVIRRDVNDLGINRCDLDIPIVVGRYVLLLCRLQIPGLLRFLAHELDRVHHILLLVVVSVAER